MSETDTAGLNRMTTKPRSAKCGTASGYASHYYHGETPCSACKDAHREYRRAWRERKRAAK